MSGIISFLSFVILIFHVSLSGILYKEKFFNYFSLFLFVNKPHPFMIYIMHKLFINNLFMKSERLYKIERPFYLSGQIGKIWRVYVKILKTHTKY